MIKRAIAFLLFGGLLAAASAAPVVYLAGDSILRDYPPDWSPQTGWGQVLGESCKPGVTVVNRAAGGRSLKQFIVQKNWDGILRQLKKGDFVIIQFGHNDQRKKHPYYANTNEYRKLLERCIADVRGKGATPVLSTSVPRCKFRKDGTLEQTLEGYPQAMRDAAAASGAGLVDLNAVLSAEFARLGPEKTEAFFVLDKRSGDPRKKDIEHLTREGAVLVAGIFVKEAEKQKLPIAEAFQ